MASLSFLTRHGVSWESLAPVPCEGTSPEQTRAAWFLAWREAECSESVKDTEKSRKNKRNMAKELVTFQTGLPDCSRGCWGWAGRGNFSHMGRIGLTVWAEKVATL